jgi:hypothetical protein
VTGVHAISTDLVTLPRYTAKVRTRASAGVRAALKTRNTAAGNRVLAHTLIECLAGQALLSLCHIDAVGAQVAHILDAIRTELCEQLLGVGRATSAVADKVPPMATRPGGATLRAGAVSTSTITCTLSHSHRRRLNVRAYGQIFNTGVTRVCSTHIRKCTHWPMWPPAPPPFTRALAPPC